jgi:hypothetical protein
MKKGLFIFLFILAAGFAGAATKDSESEKETRNVSGFNRISFGVAGELYVNIGPEFSVVLEGDKSLLQEIKTEVAGSRLVIKKDSWHSSGNEKLVAYVTLPELIGLGVSGSGKAEIKDAVKSDALDLSVSGSGKIVTAGLTIGSLDLGISGSGDVYAGNGDVQKADISISGSGNYIGESLRIGKADISISGSGGCKCNVTDNLEAHVSGSGNITYSGNPKVDARVSGSGRVRSR